eukprot:6367090-Pyramimonas_sp.AAC.1
MIGPCRSAKILFDAVVVCKRAFSMASKGPRWSPTASSSFAQGVGGVLAKMSWRSKRRDENLTLLMTRRIRAGRALLHRTGRESLVQR